LGSGRVVPRAANLVNMCAVIVRATGSDVL
jgi:hypothetical protein